MKHDRVSVGPCTMVRTSEGFQYLCCVTRLPAVWTRDCRTEVEAVPLLDSLGSSIRKGSELHWRVAAGVNQAVLLKDTQALSSVLRAWTFAHTTVIYLMYFMYIRHHSECLEYISGQTRQKPLPSELPFS